MLTVLPYTSHQFISTDWDMPEYITPSSFSKAIRLPFPQEQKAYVADKQ